MNLRHLHEITKIEVQSLLLSQPVRRETRPKDLLRAQLLDRAWELYDSDVLDIPHFLELAEYISTVLVDGNIQISIEDVDNFINIPIYRYGWYRHINFKIYKAK